MMLRLHKRLRLQANYSDHTRGVYHGPKTWPWWRLFGVLVCKTNPDLGPQVRFRSYHLWLYRPGQAAPSGENRNTAWLLHLAADWRDLAGSRA